MEESRLKLFRLMRRAKEKIEGNLSYRWNKRGLKYKHIPWLLYLEVTNRCNANCIFCGRKDTHKPLMDMDFKMFRKIIDAAPYATQVHTQGFGEPLLYPHLIDAIIYARGKGMRVIFYTNASLLDDTMALSLLRTGVDQIRFSVDAMNKADYELLRRGLVWETVLGNIENFQRRKNEGRFKTETLVAICETKENKDRLGELLEFWGNRVDVVTSIPEKNIPSHAETWACPLVDHDYDIKCPNPYTELAVKSNGDVVFCCVDWFHNYVIDNLADGEITQERLLDIYNSEKYEELRKGMETGKGCPMKCLSCQGYVLPQRD